MPIRTTDKSRATDRARTLRLTSAALLLTLGCIGGAARADTVASLLGNFTINQYCGMTLNRASVDVHYVVVFGQLPALRELHLADTNGDGVTSQLERDTYVGKLAPGLADGLKLEVAGVSVPLRATHWTSSLPTEQGGFSLRLDVDFTAALPVPAEGAERKLLLSNQNYAGRIGWHEIVVQSAPGLSVFDTNAYSTSLTGGLANALQSLPSTGPLDERSVHLTFADGGAPPGATVLAARQGGPVEDGRTRVNEPGASAAKRQETAWILRETRRLVNAISGPHLQPRIAVLALLGAMLLGAVHALSPGHGKTIVGAYLIGSRGTPRHAVFLGSTVTITHTLGVFLLGFATLYASRFIVPERLFPVLSLTSAVLVLGMGILLLVQRTRTLYPALATGKKLPTVFHPVAAAGPASGPGLIFAPSPGHDHGHSHIDVTMHSHAGGTMHSHADGTMHSHGGGTMHSHLPPGARGEKVTWRSLLALGISGGLVPCPSAMVLLLAAVALNKTVYGMLLVVAFSVGLAITLTAVGLAFLYARNRLRNPGRGARWPQLLPILSAAMITVLGVGLCFAAVRSF